MGIKKLWSLTQNGKEEHGRAFEGGHVNTERLSNAGSVNEIAGQPVANHEVREEELRQEARQIRTKAEAQASQIIADAQAAAQDQVDAMVRVAKAASEEAQKVVQSSREKAAIIMAESRREAEQLLEDTKRRLEDQIRKEVKGPVDELLTYMSDVVKKVQNLGVGLKEWEVTAPPTVDSTKGNGSTSEEIPAVKDSVYPQPAVDLKEPMRVQKKDIRGL